MKNSLQFSNIIISLYKKASMDLQSLLVILFACEVYSFKFEDFPPQQDRLIADNSNYNGNYNNNNNNAFHEKNYFSYLDDKCSKGDSTECFKLNALNGLDKFLDDSNYTWVFCLSFCVICIIKLSLLAAFTWNAKKLRVGWWLGLEIRI